MLDYLFCLLKWTLLVLDPKTSTCGLLNLIKIHLTLVSTIQCVFANSLTKILWKTFRLNWMSPSLLWMTFRLSSSLYSHILICSVLTKTELSDLTDNPSFWKLCIGILMVYFRSYLQISNSEKEQWHHWNRARADCPSHVRARDLVPL